MLCDERLARRVCAGLGIRVTGSIGLIVGATRLGRIDRATAADALRALPSIGRLHVSTELLAAAIASL